MLSILLAVFYGPLKMYDTYHRYMFILFDHKVRDLLKGSQTDIFRTLHGDRRYPIPLSVKEIATSLGMSEKRVLACLGRLKKSEQVSAEGDKWKIVVNP